MVTVSLIKLIKIKYMYRYRKHRNPQFYYKEIRKDGQGFSGNDCAYYMIIVNPLPITLIKCSYFNCLYFMIYFINIRRKQSEYTITSIHYNIPDSNHTRV